MEGEESIGRKINEAPSNICDDGYLSFGRVSYTWVLTKYSRIIYFRRNGPSPSFAFFEPSPFPFLAAQSDIERAFLFISSSGKRRHANTPAHRLSFSTRFRSSFRAFVARQRPLRQGRKGGGWKGEDRWPIGSNKSRKWGSRRSTAI